MTSSLRALFSKVFRFLAPGGRPREADQVDIEIGEPELLDLVAKLLEIPACPCRQLVVGQAVGSLFLLTPAACDHYRDRGQPQLRCRADTPVAGNQHAVLVNKHRVGPSPSAKRVGKLVDVALAMQTGIAGVGDQPLDRPVLNPLGWPGACRARLGEPRLHDHIQFPSSEPDATGIVSECVNFSRPLAAQGDGTIMAIVNTITMA